MLMPEQPKYWRDVFLLLEHLCSAFAIYDDQGVILYCKHAVSGIDRDEVMIGKNFREIFGLSNVEVFEQGMLECLSEQKISDIVVSLASGDGITTIGCNIRLIPLSAEYRPGAVFAVMTDETQALSMYMRAKSTNESMVSKMASISDRLRNTEVDLGVMTKNNEQSKFRIAAMDQMAVMGRMAGVLAHEINNPLSGIKNCFELLKSHVPKIHPDQRFISIVEKEILRLGAIIKQMYGLVRQESHKHEHVIVNIGELISDVLVVHQSAALHAKVQCYHEVDTRLKCRLQCAAVQRVLHNLIKNAIESMADTGGILTLTADEVAGELQIVVHDTGPGILPSNMSKVFEPFFTTKTQHDGYGLGLGLAVSRDLMLSAGCDLTVESSSKTGTSFTIKIPTPGA